MNQILFDITALTDFFIDQNEIPVIQNTGANSDFKNILTTSIINDKIRQECQNKTDIDLVYSILSNIPAIVINTDIIPNLSFNKYLTNENLIGDTLVQANRESICYPQIETLTPESMAVCDLKSLIEAQAIPLTLNLNRVNADVVDWADPHKFQNVISTETKGVQNDLFGGQSKGNVLPDNALLMDDSKSNAIKPDLVQTANSGYMTEGKAQYSKIIFTVDQIFDNSQDEVPVKVLDDSNSVSDMKIAVSKLIELVKNYPDKIIVEVKTTPADTRLMADVGVINTPQTIMPAASDVHTEAGFAKPPSEKFVIFNLNSLLSHDGSEKINVVQKTLSDSPQAYVNSKNQHPYLPETRFITNINHEIKFVPSINSSSTVEIAANEQPAMNQKQEMLSSVSNSPPENVKSNNQETAVKQTSQEHLTEKDDNLKNINDLDLKRKDNRQAASFSRDNVNKLTDSNSTKNNQDAKTLTTSEHSSSTNKVPIQPSQADTIQTQSSQTQDTQQQASQLQSAHRSSIQPSIQPDAPAAESRISARQADTTENIINQIKSKMVVAHDNTRMTIQLKPESLGKILIDFKYNGHKLEVLFRVDNLDVKQALDLEMPKLKADWKIDDFRVAMNNSEQQPNLSENNQRSSGMANQKSSSGNNSVNNVINADNDVLPIERNSRNPANVYGGVIDIVA